MQRDRYHALTLLFFGWLFSRSVLSTIRGDEILGFAVLPGFIIAHLLIWLFLSAHQTEGRKSSANNFNTTFFIFGIIADSSIWWIIRPGTFSEMIVTNPWQEPVWLGSFASILTILLIIKIILPNSLAHKSNTTPSALLLFMGYLCTVVIYRISYYSTLDLPNEERSIFVLGSEIHHAIFGFIGLMLLKLWQHSSYPPNRSLYSIIMGVCFGFVLDQSLYLMLKEVTDVAYGGFISWLGLILGTIALTAIILFVFKDKSYVIAKETNSQ